MLIAEHIHVRRGRRLILRDLSVQLRAGQVVGILGANGAGKSTLLAALAGELAPEQGQISLLGQPLSYWPAAAQARHRAVLPQNPSLQFDLPVATVIGMGAYPHAAGAPPSAMQDARVLQRVLDLADVHHLHDRRYRALSGGEQQRVQFARVLYQLLLARPAGDYRVLLLDEPTASLDPRHQLLLLHAVRRLARDEDIAACVILHDVNLAAGACDHLLLLADGSGAASGPPAQVLTPSVLNQVYGVPATILPHPHQPDRPLVVFSAPACPAHAGGRACS